MLDRSSRVLFAKQLLLSFFKDEDVFKDNVSHRDKFGKRCDSLQVSRLIFHPVTKMLEMRIEAFFPIPLGEQLRR
jgi:hypothetical protein